MIRKVGFRISEDKGRLLETTVCLYLKMRGHEVYFHKDKKECDFVVRENNRIVQAIQVTAQLSDGEVKRREVDGLVEAMSAYGLTEGVILTENEQHSLQVGDLLIKVIPIWKWLLNP